jgi:long-chain acyl-CoA synthetase
VSALEAIETLPALLEAQAARRPQGIAVRVKRLGIWREVTWRAYADVVRETALALDELGIGAGDRVAILAANDPRWLVADLGIQTVRATSVGLQPVQEADELVDNLVAAAPRVIVCGDQEQLDSVLAVRERVPAPQRLVVFDMKGLHTADYHGEPVVAFEQFRAAGRARHEQLPSRHSELLAAVRPDDASVVSFTSGTTGPARGVLLSQRGQVATARLLANRIGATEHDRGFSLLPLGHATARAFDIVVPLVAGSSINFAESAETIEGDLAELSPTVFFATPKVFERIRANVEIRAGRAAHLKRGAFRFGMRRLSAALAARRRRGGAPFSRILGHALIGRWVLGKAGLMQVRYAGVGGAAVAPDLLDWFWKLGVPVYEHYGQVETGGIAFAQRGIEDAGTAGTPLASEIETRVGPDGELFLRSPGLLVGRLEAAGDAGLADGWYATGDLVRIDGQGRLIPRGRRSEMLTIASGEVISAAEVATALERSPYISAAVVIAEGRPFVTALIELHQEAVGEWAKQRQKAVTTYAALAADDDVHGLIAEQVAAANVQLREAARVQAFAVTSRPLDDELTATGKIQRTAVLERYAALIDELYPAPVASAVG